MKKIEEEILTPEEINSIWDNAVEISELDLTVEDNVFAVKEVVCTFFSTHPDTKKPISLGGCAGCKNCEASHLAECRDNYINGIFDKPQKLWTPYFDEPIVRDKISPSERNLGLKCNTCHVKHRCPQFMANSLCSIDWQDDDVTELSNKDIINKLIDLQFKRVRRETLFEDIEGGKADPSVSSELDRLTGLVAQRNNLDTRHAKLTIEASESVPSDNKPGGSLLASLFGGGANNNDKNLPSSVDNTIDITSIQDKEKVEKRRDRRREQE